jgi:hypothetical protein
MLSRIFEEFRGPIEMGDCSAKLCRFQNTSGALELLGSPFRLALFLVKPRAQQGGDLRLTVAFECTGGGAEVSL